MALSIYHFVIFHHFLSIMEYLQINGIILKLVMCFFCSKSKYVYGIIPKLQKLCERPKMLLKRIDIKKEFEMNDVPC